VQVKAWEHAKNAHLEKLAKFRRQKKYESWLQDDEDDVDGERILCDIRSFNLESPFNVYFNHFDEYDF
jgi:hypothetical protein